MAVHDEISENYTASWSEISALIKRYWLLVLVVFAAGTLGTYLTLQLFFTNEYESQTSLLVKVGRENAEVPVTVQNGQVLSQGVRIADINSEVQLLSSRELIDRVVDQVGPDRFKFELKRPQSIFGYPKYYVKRVARWAKSGFKEVLIFANIKKRLSPREQAIVGLAEAVKAEPVKESDVLLLKVRLPDPQLAQEVSQLILQYYMDERAKARQIPASSDFFMSQMAEDRDHLQKLVEQREELRKRWGVSAAEQQRALLLQQSVDIQRQIAFNESEIAQLRTQDKEMSTALRSQPSLVSKEQVESPNPAIQSIKDRITALQVEHAKISSRYQPESVTVKRIDEEIAELQQTLDREQPTIQSSATEERNPVAKEFTQEVAQSSVRVAGLQSKNNDLRRSLAVVQRDLVRLNRGSDAYDSLEREYQIAEQNYITYAKKHEEARMSQELDARQLQNVSVMSGPDTPIEPIYPRHLLILEFAMPISLLLGIAFAALWQAIDDRIRDSSSLEGLEDTEFLGACKVQPFEAGTD